MDTADFQDSARTALGDPQLRSNFRRAMDGLMAKRAAMFPDRDEWTRLRSLGAAVRARSLLNLPHLLEKLEERLTANGIHVHWAETVDQGNAIFKEILAQHDAKHVVKGKSMVSEEMHLNHALEEVGIEIIEADLGEYIIQLDHETPSHIIMPAIHKNKEQIARLFSQKIKDAAYTEDVDHLTGMARQVLRKKFANADAGVSGVNVAVAETGTLVLVENEGNGRMCTTVPKLHIAVMGIEKVVERLEEVPPILQLLTRSATGQPITTYVNMISSPRKADEKDGPEEIHLVLLDNGRSRVYSDPELRNTLRCIRCGACMNHCPVYTRVGGHAYPGVYPGPIGKILTPQILGLDVAGDLPHGSSLCNACVEVCPVEIPIAALLVRLRREAVGNGAKALKSAIPPKGAGQHRSRVESWVWWGWALAYRVPWIYRLTGLMLSRFGGLMPATIPLLKEWTSVRSKPRFASRTLHEMASSQEVPND
ncbi:MAG TPA: iron-sulfur cluster-binding protein [Rhodospirillaceae bacterium]|nr:iron-sulfur cluster-binding protein [Rhodospirillaceae bacterium]